MNAKEYLRTRGVGLERKTDTIPFRKDEPRQPNQRQYIIYSYSPINNKKLPSRILTDSLIKQRTPRHEDQSIMDLFNEGKDPQTQILDYSFEVQNKVTSKFNLSITSPDLSPILINESLVNQIYDAKEINKRIETQMIFSHLNEFVTNAQSIRLESLSQLQFKQANLIFYLKIEPFEQISFILQPQVNLQFHLSYEAQGLYCASRSQKRIVLQDTLNTLKYLANIQNTDGRRAWLRCQLIKL